MQRVRSHRGAGMRNKLVSFAVVPALLLSGCATWGPLRSGPDGVTPAYSFAVTNNDTPYSQCLESWGGVKPPARLPRISVGEIADKTGQVSLDDNQGRALSQGASEMVMSALYKTGKVALVERLDLRIPLAEVQLAEQSRLDRDASAYSKLPASDFILVGAITELNYNIVTGGARVAVEGIGAGARWVVVNVALDLRVVDSKTFAVRYVTSLQKQVVGHEIAANVFSFFGGTLVELDAGKVRNEPLQLGLRSVAEMSVYQIMTKFLGLPTTESCTLVESGAMASYLQQLAPKDG
jgi:curli biogenesis system outer membrane secretion channel CsgG